MLFANVLLCAVLTLATNEGYPSADAPAAPKAELANGIYSEHKITVPMYGSNADLVIEVPLCAAVQSTLARNMIDDQYEEGADEQESLPMPNVKPQILDLVVEYLCHHSPATLEELTITNSKGDTKKIACTGKGGEIQKPLKSTNLAECGVEQWDVDFLAAIDQETLFEVILAANFMDIKPLLDLSCAKVASMIKGKTTEEIRTQFNITAELTKAEEEQIREENRWAEDK